MNFKGGVLVLNGFSNDKLAIGNISVRADSVIDFSHSKAERLQIADVSDNEEWNKEATLTIKGFDPGDSLRFGKSADALTPDQLSKIKFDGKPARIDDQGYVTPSTP